MKDWWLRFGCFITGYNYKIIKASSEGSAKAVKKYVSAILIISMLWGFIGYAFTRRYLHGDKLLGAVGAVVMIIMVIQVERQIILTIGKNYWARGFRVAIGLIMAVIGSVILDQIIFKDDIEKKKMQNVIVEVDQMLPVKTKELDQQIQNINAQILAKERERSDINNANPFEKQNTVETRNIPTRVRAADGTYRDTIITRRDIKVEDVPNHRLSVIPQITDQIQQLTRQRIENENMKLHMQDTLTTQMQSKVGFLDELNILFGILFTSRIALFIWCLLFLFFFSIELFVLVNKIWDQRNDYDQTILHQMDVRIKMLEHLSEKEYSNQSPSGNNRF
jgi:hypothetical protein